MRLLAWQYHKKGMPVPKAAEIRAQAEAVVDQAHAIAKKRGKNVLSIMKQAATDFVNRPKP